MTGRIFRWLAAPRAPGASPRGRGDWLLVAAVLAVGSLEVSVRADLDWSHRSVVTGLALAPLLLVRRTHPLVAVLMAFGTGLLVDVVDPLPPDAPQLVTQMYLLMLPYALARWAAVREVVVGAIVLAGAASTTLLHERAPIGDVIGGLAVLSASIAIGTAVRLRARDRIRELEQVKLREREQLARELHDTVAHHVSAIAIRAQAGLALAPVRPEAPADALRLIEGEASRALREMRAMVRTLRDGEEATRTPAARLTDIERLVDHDDDLTLAVDLRGPVSELPGALSAALFPLVREAITNARRHARAASRVDVAVVVDHRRASVVIRDDGVPVAASPAGVGYGLVGMRERTELLGGTFSAGPGPERGWVVRVDVPLASPAEERP